MTSGSTIDKALVPDHELIKRIGRGAYGEVWLARNRTTGTLRAVKIVFRHEFEDKRPYQREFEGQLKFEPISHSHPSQPAILHIGRDEAVGCFCYVMELADDGSGADEKRGKGEREPIPSAPLPPFPFSRYTPRTLRSEIKTRSRLPAAKSSHSVAR